ncbi:FkbM family methyltransferase [Neoroseomonas rubea]|uniref:FkbM family methyltransferase n=1 Tax=Neoroseomonas rubea TaxID=2748666 RepID=UPI0018E056E2|nr:FkbM family methyltransferase [Roseomonas rubea]
MDDHHQAEAAPGIAGRLAAIEERLDRLAIRLEESIAYFAPRVNRVADSQTIYLGDNTAVTFLEDGTRLMVDTRSLDIGVHLLTLGQWEPAYTALFRRLVRPGDTVLDLGANLGVYTMLAARLTGPGGRVHAFEPNPRLSHLVDVSIRINGCAGWTQVHRLAASDRRGVARLFFTDAYSGGGSLTGNAEQHDSSGSSKNAVDCELAPIDEVLADPDLRVDVMKMDVEGHEGPALRGMRAILERSPGIRIMMEFGPQMMRGSGMPAPEVVALLEGLGLSAWTIGEDGGTAPVEWSVLAAATGGLQNILVARESPF